MPRLSVLLPAYNAEATIGTAVKTTLRDLPNDAELVVLDDGSSDRTSAVVESVTDPRLRLHSRPNKGVAMSLNELIDITDSEFIARMDADDLVLPGRFSRQLRALTGAAGRSNGGAADAVFTTVVEWGGRRPQLPRLSLIGSKEFGMHLLLTNPVAHSTLVARRSTIVAAGKYRVLPAEDYDLWLRLAHAGAKLRRLAAPGLAYRVHREQVTASDEWRRQSWQSSDVASSYSSLAEVLIGAPSMRISSLSIDTSFDANEKREQFFAFEARFTDALKNYDPAVQKTLRRKLAERRAWFERQIAAEERSAPDAARATESTSRATERTSRATESASRGERGTPKDGVVAPEKRSPREQYRVAVRADRLANRPYPKSRFVLRWFRYAQLWRARSGPVSWLMFVLVGGTYKVVTEGVMGIELPVSTRVGPGLRLRHGFGVVVNPASRIGANVMLRHGVTLGNRRLADDCPVIEDDVEIGVGAVVVGAVTIGQGAKIGPNAVVFHDVPAGAVVYSPASERSWP